MMTRFSISRRKTAIACGLLSILTVLADPAASHVARSLTPDGVLYQNCHELLGFQQVPLENVRAQVPLRYEDVDHNDDGLGEFYVSTRFCEQINVGGEVVHNAIDSHISIFLGPVREPTPHASSLAGQPFDVYLVQWVTNNQPFATWMKQSTGLGDKVKLVHNLVFDYNPVPGHNHLLPGAVDENFQLVVPDPATSPFRIDAKVYEPWGCLGIPIDAFRCSLPGGLIAENWWADTDEGTVIIHAESPEGASGAVSAPAEGTITSDDLYSPLGQLFGGPDGMQSRPLCSDSSGQAGATCPKDIGDPVGSNFFTEVQLTKCVRRVPGDCTDANH